MRKVLESAIANARVKADKAGEPFRENDLVVKETYVDEGVTLKRFRARAILMHMDWEDGEKDMDWYSKSKIIWKALSDR